MNNVSIACASVTIVNSLQLEFYDILGRANSSLKSHIPEVIASGILYFENGSYKVVPWDGKRIPDILTSSSLNFDASMLNSEFPYGIWNKTLLQQRNKGKPPAPDSFGSLSSHVWPYIITQRCKGKIFAQL